MRVDAYASRPHFLDHLAPVWRELDPRKRGSLYVSNRMLEAREPEAVRGEPDGDVLGPVLVASAEDLRQVTRRRPIIYLEHGSGQSYPADPRSAAHVSYSGGRERRQVKLFLVPNLTVAERDRAMYPDAEAAIVGCPRLDGIADLRPTARIEPGVLGLTWHWDCYLCPEARSAWPAWKLMVRRIAEVWPGPVLGHAHPRLWPVVRSHYEARGIEPIAGADEFLCSADVVAFDNTSLGYEAAALGIPTVVLNAPWYRREISHGLRFWDLLPGPELDPAGDGTEDAETLSMAAMLATRPHWREHSEQVAEQVYPLLTRGRAARLAAAAIEEMRA
jgi:hypothetical protein